MPLTQQLFINKFNLFFFSKVTQEAGTGLFADFSNVQYVTISGMVCSKDPSTGEITYHQEVMYGFSCRYPLQYLVNNTQMSVWVTLQTKMANFLFFYSTPLSVLLLFLNEEELLIWGVIIS